MTAAAALIIGIVAGWIIKEFAIDRRDRATLAASRDGWLDHAITADVAQVRLQGEVDQLAHDLACARAHLAHHERRFWLPTIDGVRAANRDAVTLADDFRRDFDGGDVVELFPCERDGLPC